MKFWENIGIGCRESENFDENVVSDDKKKYKILLCRFLKNLCCVT
mgnify:CR=1 FL=1